MGIMSFKMRKGGCMLDESALSQSPEFIYHSKDEMLASFIAVFGMLHNRVSDLLGSVNFGTIEDPNETKQVVETMATLTNDFLNSYLSFFGKCTISLKYYNNVEAILGPHMKDILMYEAQIRTSRITEQPIKVYNYSSFIITPDTIHAVKKLYADGVLSDLILTPKTISTVRPYEMSEDCKSFNNFAEYYNMLLNPEKYANILKPTDDTVNVRYMINDIYSDGCRPSYYNPFESHDAIITLIATIVSDLKKRQYDLCCSFIDNPDDCSAQSDNLHKSVYLIINLFYIFTDILFNVILRTFSGIDKYEACSNFIVDLQKIKEQ